MKNAIELRGLEKTYPGFNLGPIDLAIPKGCFIGYIGENGAGKSTTIKLILGLLQPDEGEINVLGHDMRQKDTSLFNQIGVVFDQLHLPPEMKIKNVGKFCALSFDTWQSPTFNSYLKSFHLPLEKKVKDLSRGMAMKLSLAIALSHEAELLILDEPTSGLDPVIRDEILDILLDFLQDENHTILISSHILSDLEKAADYIIFLHEGRILFMEQKDMLCEKYALCSVDHKTAANLNPRAVVGRRKHAFGQDLLVLRDLVPEDMELVRPSIEDIMVFIIKGEDNESATL